MEDSQAHLMARRELFQREHSSSPARFSHGSEEGRPIPASASDAFAKLLADREIASNDHIKNIDPISILKYAENIIQGYKVQLDQPIYKMFQKYLDNLSISTPNNSTG